MFNENRAVGMLGSNGVVGMFNKKGAVGTFNKNGAAGAFDENGAAGAGMFDEYRLPGAFNGEYAAVGTFEEYGTAETLKGHIQHEDYLAVVQWHAS